MQENKRVRAIATTVYENFKLDSQTRYRARLHNRVATMQIIPFVSKSIEMALSPILSLSERHTHTHTHVHCFFAIVSFQIFFFTRLDSLTTAAMRWQYLQREIAFDTKEREKKKIFFFCVPPRKRKKVAEIKKKEKKGKTRFNNHSSLQR